MGQKTAQVKKVYSWFLLKRNPLWEKHNTDSHVVDLIQVSPHIDSHSAVTPYQAPSLTVSLIVIPRYLSVYLWK